ETALLFAERDVCQQRLQRAASRRRFADETVHGREFKNVVGRRRSAGRLGKENLDLFLIGEVHGCTSSGRMSFTSLQYNTLSNRASWKADRSTDSRRGTRASGFGPSLWHRQ